MNHNYWLVGAMWGGSEDVLPLFLEMAKAAKLQAQNQANEKVRAKQQAQEKADTDRRALELAERVGREERANELKACQATEGYKLYSVSATIEYKEAPNKYLRKAEAQLTNPVC